MDGFIKADIFFLVTTVAVLLVGVGLIISFVYIINILRDIKRISRSVREESEKIVQDVESVRKSLAFKTLAFLSQFTRRKKNSKTK